VKPILYSGDPHGRTPIETVHEGFTTVMPHRLFKDKYPQDLTVEQDSTAKSRSVNSIRVNLTTGLPFYISMLYRSLSQQHQPILGFANHVRLSISWWRTDH
jgi:hypothetical protein